MCSHQIHETSFLTLPVCPRRPEAAEVGGSPRRLDPRPRRQDAAQEEDHVQQEEGVRPSAGGRQDVREQEEEEVAAAVCVLVDFKLADTFSPVWPPRLRGLSLGCRRPPPTRWTGSKLGGNRRAETGFQIKHTLCCLTSLSLTGSNVI